jgi:orotate phosphoribosyltransferase
MGDGTSSDLAGRVVTTLNLPTALREPRTDFDKYRLQSDASLLRAIVAKLVALIPSEVDIIGGLEMGGATLAAAMSFVDGRPWALVRRQRGDASDRRAAGTSVANRRVVLVKDMTQTGKALASATVALRNEGATVDHAVCAIEWTADADTLLAAAGVQLHSVLTLETLREAWLGNHSQHP